jgi:hypothetical protein
MQPDRNRIKKIQSETMFDEANYSEAICELKKHFVSGQKAYFTWVVPHCPICGKRHTHGGGNEEEKVDEFLGYRVAHCTDRKGMNILTSGYRLVRKKEGV